MSFFYKTKKNVVCKKRNISEIPRNWKALSCCQFVSGCEQSVRRTQWQIHQARRENKISRVHFLQKHLCESFCAKLLATEYAIINLGLDCPGVHSLAFSTNPTKHYSRKSKSSSCSAARATFIPEGWKVDIAQSLWSTIEQKMPADLNLVYTKSVFSTSVEEDVIFSESSATSGGISKEEHSLGERHGIQKRCFSLSKQAKVAKSKHLSTLRQLLKGKIREQAKQIHAFLVLEPEWQAVFSQSEGVLSAFVDKKAYKKRSSLSEPSCRSRAVGTKPLTRTFWPVRNSVPAVPKQSSVHESGGISECEKIIKRIKLSLNDPLFPQCVFTASVRELLHTVDEQVLLQKVNTFKAMEDQIKLWLKHDTYKTNSSTSQDTQDYIRGKQNGSLKTQNKNTSLRLSILPHSPLLAWRKPLLRHSDLINPSLRPSLCRSKVVGAKPSERSCRSKAPYRNDVPAWPSTGYSLYSCFPQTLWQKQFSMQESSQIEDHAFNQNRIIVSLLSRIVLDDFFKKTQLFAKALVSSSKYSCYKSQSKDNQRAQQPPFCAGYMDDFVIIHPDKELLEACIVKAQNELSGVATCKNHKPAFLHQKELISHVYKQRSKRSQDVISTPVEDLSPKIKDCRQGFSWLGFQFIQLTRPGSAAYVCKVTPSKESVQDLLLLIKNRAKQSQSASTGMWIARLNVLLCRWLDYYKHCEYKRSYQQICYSIWEKSRPWLSRRKVQKNVV